jgi:hypothetical protein
MRKNTSYDHSIRELTLEEIQEQRTLGENHYKFLVDHPRKDYTPIKEKIIFMERRCRFSRCQNQSKYMLFYTYVTGKGGRTSTACKPICEHHAAKYLEGK